MCAIPHGMGDHGPECHPISHTCSHSQRSFLEPAAYGICHLLSLTTSASTILDLSDREKILQDVPPHDVAGKLGLSAPEMMSLASLPLVLVDPSGYFDVGDPLTGLYSLHLSEKAYFRCFDLLDGLVV